MSDAATLRQYRAEAVEARHALATGNMVEGVGRDGRSTRYSSMSLPDIDRYIDRLDREIADAEAAEAGRPRRRAIGFRYGN